MINLMLPYAFVTGTASKDEISNLKDENRDLNDEINRLEDEILNSLDLVLASMEVKDQEELFKEINGEKIYYLFKTAKRKRKGQLIKFCNKYLPGEVKFTAEGLKRTEFKEFLLRLEKNKNFEQKKKSIKYNGDDIKILDNQKNWKPWQIKIFKKFFNIDFSFKKPEERIIYSVVDVEGQSGKSIFFKWLLVKIGEDKIGRITFGTASQLRSSIINMGAKKMYILDLTKTKARDDSEEDLMSILESIADGMLFSPMYGKGASLLIEPSHILIMSNYLLDYELLSMDRWRVYEILPNGDLGIENEIFEQPEARKKILRKQFQKQLKRIEAKKLE